MKIVMAARAVFPYHGYGGMQLYIYHLAKRLVKKGIDVEIVTSYMDRKETYSETYEGIKYTFLPVKTSEMHRDNALIPKEKRRRSKGIIQRIREKVPEPILKPMAFIPTILFLLNDTLRFYRFSKRVAEYLKDKKLDVLHFYDIAGYHYAKEGKKPTVMQTFGNESFYDKRKADYLGYALFRQLIRKSFRLCTIAGTCGDINAEDITRISGIPKEKIRVMQNGINTEKIPAGKKEDFRKELDFENDETVFITINRLSPDKHVDMIIRAFKKASIKGSKLISIGAGIEEAKLKALTKKIGIENDVIFLKGLPDDIMYRHLKASDAFVNAADTRYLLLTVLESMACSLPIITTFPMQKAAVHNQNGIVTETDEHAIAEAMRKLSDRNLARRMGEASRRKAHAYDWKKIAEEDIKAYKEAISVFRKKT